MKFKTILLLGALISMMSFFACDFKNHTEPELNVNNTLVLGQAIYVNASPLNPRGLNTLHINEGDTVGLMVTTDLLKDPNYSWSPVDGNVIKFVKETDDPTKALAIATGDSGATTTVKLRDSGNNAERSLNIVVEKHWADPAVFDYIGSVGGHYYYMSSNLKTWVQAVDVCEQAGGYLATINSMEENDLLDEGRGRVENVWIGLSFIKVGNSWKLQEWVTGEPLDFENFRSKPGDPGIFAEYYFHLDYGGKWENWHEQPLNYFLEME